MVESKTPRCKDCVAARPALIATYPKSGPKAKWRPAPYPGPRCGTCHRAKVKAQKAAAAENRNQKVYGLAPGEYDRIKEHQGGVCALCLRATGASKRLAVDHDHRTGEARGLLCGPCNRGVLGHAHDDPEFFRRCIAYLEDPPAKRLARQAIQANWDRR